MAEVASTQNSLIREELFEVDNGWTIAYRYHAAPGPLLIFLNGMGDDYSSWAPLEATFGREHTLHIDLRGQGRTLKEHHLANPALHCRFPFGAHATDICRLIDALKIEDPVRIVGFSYGGGVALDFASRWPEKTDRLALIAPYVLRLDRAFPAQRIWSAQWRMAKNFGLLPNPLAEIVERNYEKFLSHYMNHRFQNRLSDERYRSVAIEMTHEIMKFNALEIVDRLPEKSVFLLTSEVDTLVPHSLFREFWNHLPESKRGHWMALKEGEHLLLEDQPEIVAKWLKGVLHGAK